MSGNLVNSFIRGSNFVEGMQERNRQRQRQDTMDEREAQEYAYRKDKRQKLDAQADEDRQYLLQRRQNEEDDRAYNLSRRKVQESADSISLANAQLSLDASRRKAEKEKLAEKLMPVLAKMGAGKALTAEDVRLFEGTPLDFNRITEPEYYAALQTLDDGMNPKNQKMLSQDEFLQALNLGLADVINRPGGAHPETGSKAVKKEVMSLYPGAGEAEYRPALRVHYEDGSVREGLPMTRGRDSNPDAEVYSVSLKDLIDQVKVRRHIADLASKEEYGAWLTKYAEQNGLLAAPKPGTQKGASTKASYEFGGQRLSLEQMEKLYKTSVQTDDMGNRLSTLEDFLWAGDKPERRVMLKNLEKLNRQLLKEGKPPVGVQDLLAKQQSMSRTPGNQSEPSFARIINQGASASPSAAASPAQSTPAPDADSLRKQLTQYRFYRDKNRLNELTSEQLEFAANALEQLGEMGDREAWKEAQKLYPMLSSR